MWIATLLAGFSTATSAMTDDRNQKSLRRSLYVSSCLFSNESMKKGLVEMTDGKVLVGKIMLGAWM